MNRPVLMGGLQPLRSRSILLWIVWVWLPVAVCLTAVAWESTDTFSSAHTSGWLRHLAERIFGVIAQPTWDRAHHAVRKTGHFVGYGLMGLAWLRAWLLMSVLYLRRLTPAAWRGYAIAMALSSTMLSATVDEIHQTYIPSRTGLASDALLDTSGAATLILLISLSWLCKNTSLASRKDSMHTTRSA
ncbi:MAG: VanZ family protein [Janthinobacterium lividum]